jgi:8-oxo-dGTP diphosphatase
MEKQVRVGVGIFVFKNGKFLLMQRKGSLESDTWSLPGGHLEFGESFAEAATRELQEETGLVAEDIQFGAVLNNHFSEDEKQYVSIWLTSSWKSGEEYITEPDKCQQLGWFDFETLPAPLFLPWLQFLNSEFYKTVKQRLLQSAR